MSIGIAKIIELSLLLTEYRLISQIVFLFHYNEKEKRKKKKKCEKEGI